MSNGRTSRIIKINEEMYQFLLKEKESLEVAKKSFNEAIKKLIEEARRNERL